MAVILKKNMTGAAYNIYFLTIQWNMLGLKPPKPEITSNSVCNFSEVVTNPSKQTTKLSDSSVH